MLCPRGSIPSALDTSISLFVAFQVFRQAQKIQAACDFDSLKNSLICLSSYCFSNEPGISTLRQAYDDLDFKESLFINGECTGAPDSVVFKPLNTCDNSSLYNVIFGGFLPHDCFLLCDSFSIRHQTLSTVSDRTAVVF